jgi:hypothetical protein
VQFLKLWFLVQEITLQDGLEDSSWKFSANGLFSTRYAYQAFFARQTALPAARQVWDSFAPLNHKFFGWLAIRDRCWTAVRLERRGLPPTRVPAPFVTPRLSEWITCSFSVIFCERFGSGSCGRLVGKTSFRLPRRRCKDGGWRPLTTCR